MTTAMMRMLTTALSAMLFALFAACGADDAADVGSAAGGSGGNGGGSGAVGDPTEQVPDNGDDSGNNDGDNGGSDDAESGSEDSENEKDADMKITLRAGGVEFTATLDDTAAGRAFARMLPLTLDMAELNGNEKYHYMQQSLPVSAVRCETIACGDLMLYGSNCVVLFYKTFASGYSYTRLGRVDNPDGLAEALCRGDAEVVFE